MPTKVCPVKLMVFPVVMYGCESRTIKKAECWRIDAFELWCWRRLLRVPWTARRSNQSILKEISPEYSLEGLMLKLEHFGHQMQRADSLEKTDAGKDWRQEEKGMTGDEMGGWHHWLNGPEFEQALGNGEGPESLESCRPRGCTESDTTEWLKNIPEIRYIPGFSVRHNVFEIHSHYYMYQLFIVCHCWETFHGVNIWNLFIDTRTPPVYRYYE